MLAKDIKMTTEKSSRAFSNFPEFPTLCNAARRIYEIVLNPPCTALSELKADATTHRLDGLFQSKYFLLQKVECSGFSSVACEGGRARAVNAVHPVFEFDLEHRGEKITS